ncbi:MAG: adenylate/guanylate cyclase domain-containing protein [Oscillospiraceae bacterium]|nr:adenylate/guanylate cyclase domain-containing protein [Oscillospiraceae bacterium]
MNDADRIRELEEENRSLKAALEQRNQLVRETFGKYLTEEVLEEVIKKKGEVRIGGERRRVTILFTDLRRSTELSEEMSPKGFLHMLNHFLKEMVDIINAWRGNVLDYVGDAIVAVYGAPKTNPDSAMNAVASAVAMQCRMEAVNAWNRDHGYPEIAMGIGIHTGDALLGNIGSDIRTKYDMIGRNVNLASRIEGFTEGGQILVSSETLAAAGDLVKTDPAGEMLVRPKGIKGEIPLHRVIGFGRRNIPG